MKHCHYTIATVFQVEKRFQDLQGVFSHDSVWRGFKIHDRCHRFCVEGEVEWMNL